MKSLKTTASEVLINFPIFEDLEDRDLEKLDRIAHKQFIPKYGAIYETGNSSDAVYFLLKGIVKTGTISQEGREVIKHVYHPLAMFGELCIVGEPKRQEFAMAMNQQVELYIMKKSALQLLMQENQQLSFKFLNHIGQRLRKAENRLESMIFKDARERIIDFLKESARKRGKKIGYEMLIKHCLTQQDIANITGTSRQTVTSVLNDLKKANLIHFNRRSILIRDLGKLA